VQGAAGCKYREHRSTILVAVRKGLYFVFLLSEKYVPQEVIVIIHKIFKILKGSPHQIRYTQK
jgi:hypothetical protein